MHPTTERKVMTRALPDSASVVQQSVSFINLVVVVQASLSSTPNLPLFSYCCFCLFSSTKKDYLFWRKRWSNYIMHLDGQCIQPYVQKRPGDPCSHPVCFPNLNCLGEQCQGFCASTLRFFVFTPNTDQITVPNLVSPDVLGLKLPEAFTTSCAGQDF